RKLKRPYESLQERLERNDTCQSILLGEPSLAIDPVRGRYVAIDPGFAEESRCGALRSLARRVSKISRPVFNTGKCRQSICMAAVSRDRASRVLPRGGADQPAVPPPDRCRPARGGRPVVEPRARHSIERLALRILHQRCRLAPLVAAFPRGHTYRDAARFRSP